MNRQSRSTAGCKPAGSQMFLFFFFVCLLILLTARLPLREITQHFYFFFLRRRVKGPRGLEIRGHGVGPSIPLDIYSGRPRRNGCHHSAGAFAVRRPRTHRQTTVGDFQHGQESAPAE